MNQLATHSRSRKRGIVIALLAVSAALLLAYRYTNTAPVAPASLTLFGNIDVRQVNLSFKNSGRIESLSVDEGDAIESGQVIATLEKRYFEDDLKLAQALRDQAVANFNRLKNGSRPEEIEQAEAQESTAAAAFSRAGQDWERTELLMEQKAISRQEFDASRALYLEAEAALKSAQAALQLMKLGPRDEDIAAGQAQVEAAAAQVQIVQRRLTDAVLTAPHTGVILTRAREVGAIVNAGETIATLTLASPVWVRSYIGEVDLGSIQPGIEVTVVTDSAANRKYIGKVGFISSTAEFTPKAVETAELRTSLVYRLRIVVEDPDGGLRQGMPVTISVPIDGNRPRRTMERMFDALGWSQSR